MPPLPSRIVPHGKLAASSKLLHIMTPLPTTPELPDHAREFRRTLRHQSIARREALPEAQHQQFTQALRDHLRQAFPQLAGMRVAFCWPFRCEPDLRPLILHWLEQGETGFMALLPVVTAPATPLAFRSWRPETPLRAGSYGIPFPAEGEFIVPEALLIPVNAFDAAGFRIGYGGGFFDRTLASLTPRPLAIGVGFDFQQVSSTRPQSHDLPLDAIVTESKLLRPQR